MGKFPAMPSRNSARRHKGKNSYKVGGCAPIDPVAAEALVYWCERDVVSFIYFVREEDEGPIKIGEAIKPHARVLGLQCGNPRELRIVRIAVGGRDLERHIHGFWQHPAGLRGEWFGKGHEEAILDSATRIERAQRDAFRAGHGLDAFECHQLLVKTGLRALFAKDEEREAA